MNDFLSVTAVIVTYFLVFGGIVLFVTWRDNRRWNAFFNERKRQVNAQYEHDKQMCELLDRLSNELGTSYEYEDGMSMNAMREMFGFERI